MLVQNGSTFCDIHGGQGETDLVNLLVVEDETSLQRFLALEPEELSDVERLLLESEKTLDAHSQLIDNIVLEPDEEETEESLSNTVAKNESAIDEIPMEVTESMHLDESQHQNNQRPVPQIKAV